MSEQKSPQKKECVLVVDDAREIREFLTEYILEPRGFRVLTAADGLQGLQMAFSEQPDLMIVDVQMPHMSGLELLRRLRVRRLDIPAILITAHGSEQVAVKALRLGVRDYVIKPFVIEDMEEAIDRALREKRLWDERNQLVKQLQRSNASLRQRAQQLNALYSIGKAVSSSLELEQILERVVEAAVYLSGTDEGSLMLIDERQGELYVRASKNVDTRARTIRERIQDSQAGQAIRTRQTTILTRRDLAPAPAEGPKGPEAVAYIPLLVGGHPIGVLTVATRKPDRPLTKRETRVLSALASFAASAIQNARLHQSLRQERNQLQTIIEESENPVLLLDERERLLVVNRAARQALNLPAGELRGQAADRVLARHPLLDFIQTGWKSQAETTLEADGGAHFQVNLTVLRDGQRSIMMHPLRRKDGGGAAGQ